MLRSLLKYIVSRLSERYFNIVGFHYLHLKCGTLRALNLKEPKTFNEKIIYCKMHNKEWSNALYADKLEVKEFVRSKIGGEYVIETLGAWSDVSRLNVERLPANFILKANHGSGWNHIVSGKDPLSDAKIEQLDEWLNTNYYDVGREYQYRDIRPRIFAEPFLTDSSGARAIDYQFFCFHGQPKYIQVEIDRYHDHRRNFYDLDWNLQNIRILYEQCPDEIERPKKLNEMIKIATSLSQGFRFVRVDLYFLEGRIYFGELTLHPGGGFAPFFPRSADRKLGDMLFLD